MPSKPNVLFLFSDQHHAEAMGCAGHPIVQTPTFDRLAQEGVRFTRAYCQDAICVPSRTSMMSGVYPRTTGCLDNPNEPPDADRYAMLQHVFAANGYKTGCFGKRHLPFQHGTRMCLGWDRSATTISPRLDPSDDDYWQWLKDNGLWETYRATEGEPLMKSDLFCMVSKLEPEQRDAAYTADKAIDFIHENKDQPFFCWASFHGPHHAYNPPRKWIDMYPADKMPLPANVDEPVENLPPELQVWRRDMNPPWNLGAAAENKELYQQFISHYYAQVTEVDHYAGRILDALEQQGLRDNTIVIYASDHGDFMGRHGMAEKCSLGHNVYEDTLKVPLIISWPGKFPQAMQRADLVELLDLYPTLAELLELKMPGNMQELAGKSLRPALEQTGAVDRNYAVSENWSQVTVVTGRYKLGVWIDPGTLEEYRKRDIRGQHPDMLFDLEQDPMEQKNLINDPACADVREQLYGYYREWVAKTPDTGRQALIDAAG